MSKPRILVLALALLAATIMPALAQPAVAPTPPAAASADDQSGVKPPPLPTPLQNLQSQGAQMRYLGREGGLDGWIAIQNGQEQYFYVTPDQASFVLGLQFDNQGKVITLRQVQKLQKASGSDVLNYLANGVKPQTPEEAKVAATGKPPVDKAFKTPSEAMFTDVEGSNWIPLGNPNAPYIYMFDDPQCPYCKKFMDALRQNDIPNGLIQVRIIPVGIHGPDSVAQAAFLLAAPHPQDVYFKHLDGDTKALPVDSSISTQGVERNLSIMQSWKFNGTPTTVYRSKNGQVKILQGVATDIPGLIADLAAPSTPAAH
jgi:thiol:disulfide interchange protein DsbG